MQCFTTSRSAIRSASTVGSGFRSRTVARRLAMRRAAATRKCPEPHAGSQTVTASKASAMAVDERGRRVVRAGALPLVAGHHVEEELALLLAPLGYQLEERLVDRAEFLRAEVLVVHPAPASGGLVVHPGQRLDCGEQVLVGQLQAAQDLVSSGVVVDPAEADQAEPRQAVLVAKGVEDEPDRPP